MTQKVVGVHLNEDEARLLLELTGHAMRDFEDDVGSTVQPADYVNCAVVRMKLIRLFR